MPRDLSKEITELKNGIHQFIMAMYCIFEKIVEEKEAKGYLLKALQDEIDYVKASDESLQDNSAPVRQTIALLEAKKSNMHARLKKSRDDIERYDLADAINEVEDVIDYLKSSI